MKDYTDNKIDAMFFIKNYEIINNEIHVHLASGEDYIVPNTEANIEIINSQMEEQIETDDYIKGLRQSDIITKAVGSVCIPLTLVAHFSSNGSPEGYLATGAFVALSAASFIVNRVNIHPLMKDYAKNSFFHENKDYINTHINDNRNILSKVSKSTKAMIEEKADNDEELTLNDMDKISVKDLAKIYNNITRDAIFDFEYEDPEQSSAYTRKRKK